MSGNTSKRYPAELKQRAVRMFGEVRGDHVSEWAAMAKVAELLGIGTPETLRKWVRQAEIDQGARAGATSDLSWLCLVRTLGEGVEDRLGLGRDAWLGCEALVADHDGRGA